MENRITERDNNENDKIKLQNLIVENFKILDIFQDLSEFFMLDFYTNNGHKLLPSSWLDVAKSYKGVFLQQLCNMVLKGHDSTVSLPIVMPLSLICFVKLINTRLKTRRKPVSVSVPHELPVTCKEQLRHLKPKKKLELTSLLPIIKELIIDNEITHIVDIGSGVGHGSRFIAKQHPDCFVLRIEAQSSLIGKAENIDQKFSNNQKPVNIVSSVNTLRLDNNIVESFHSILTEIDVNNGTCKFTNPESRILLLGLHPCGNLGSFMLKLFKESYLCKGIIAVSCCYLFIDAQTGGFPLSNFVQSIEINELSCQLKEQSSHNAEFYLTRLLTSLEAPEEMLVQSWRSIADVFISKRYPNYLIKCFKFKRRSNKEDVISFINKNLVFHQMQRLGDDEEQEALELSVVDQWKTWAYYLVYIVKLSLGVVGESLILHDRLLYLIESNISAQFNIVFDALDSPRNTAIVGTKY